MSTPLFLLPPPTLLPSLPPMQIPSSAVRCFSSRPFSSAYAALFFFLQTAGPALCCKKFHSRSISLFLHGKTKSHHSIPHAANQHARPPHTAAGHPLDAADSTNLCVCPKMLRASRDPARVPFILDVAALGWASYRLHLLARAADRTKLAAGAKRLCPFRSRADLLSAKQLRCACSRSTGVVPVLESFQRLTSCYLKPGFALFPRRACLQLPALASEASSFSCPDFSQHRCCYRSRLAIGQTSPARPEQPRRCQQHAPVRRGTALGSATRQQRA